MLKIVALFTAICLVGCASSPPSKRANSDGTSPAIFTKGSGKTKEAAFRDAVRNAAGLIISSQTELNGGALVKDQILDYSSGYIESYEIIQESSDFVEIRALVSSDKVAHRILGRSLNQKNIKDKSRQLFGQTTTTIQAREAGDELLNNLIRDFPNKALNVRVGDLKIKLDRQKNTLLLIPVTINWSKAYLEALEQTVRYLSIDKCYACNKTIKFSSGLFDFGKFTGYQLIDDKQFSIATDGFPSSVGVKLTYHGKSDDSISRCYRLDLQASPNPPVTQLLRFDFYNRSLDFQNSSKSLTIEETVDYRVLGQLQRIDAEVVLKCRPT